MRSCRIAIVVALLVIVVSAALALVSFTLRFVPPQISIRFGGYVQGSGLALFTISNASPCAVVYSGRYRIQCPAIDRWMTLTQACLPAGEILLPGRCADIKVIPPSGQNAWRVDLDVTRDRPLFRRRFWLN
jgi:hypothetical protein